MVEGLALHHVDLLQKIYVHTLHARDILERGCHVHHAMAATHSFDSQKLLHVITSPLSSRYLDGWKRFRRSAFVSTETELMHIAVAAMMGFRSGPPKTYRRPAATGMPSRLKPKAQNRFCMHRMEFRLCDRRAVAPVELALPFLEDVGHSPMVENPARFKEILSRFIAE